MIKIRCIDRLICLIENFCKQTQTIINISKSEVLSSTDLTSYETIKETKLLGVKERRFIPPKFRWWVGLLCLQLDFFSLEIISFVASDTSDHNSYPQNCFLLIPIFVSKSHIYVVFVIKHIMTNYLKFCALRLCFFGTEYDSMQSTQISISDHPFLHVFVNPSKLNQRGPSYWKGKVETLKDNGSLTRKDF